MRKTLAAAALLVLGLGLAPIAAHATCAPPGDASEATVPVSMAPAGQGDVYVDADGPGVWQETNGLPGLQTADYTCDGVTTPHDTKLTP